MIDPEISERFIRESMRVEELRVKYKLDFLVKIYDVLFKDHAFVMEYLKVDSKDYLAEKQDKKFLNNLIYAVYKLHQIGVSHRDIKPQNIRVRNNGPVIIDFGVASWWDSKSNLVPAGTRYYSPPEIVSIFNEYRSLSAARKANKELIDICPDNTIDRIKSIKRLHDVYSLGITLGEFLTGSVPFNKNSYVTYLEKGTCEDYENWLKKIPDFYRKFVKTATGFSPVNRSYLRELIGLVEQDNQVEVSEYVSREERPYFQESKYECLSCHKDTMPPANFCPFCGEDLNTVVLEISPKQHSESNNLPEGLQVSEFKYKGAKKLALIIDLKGQDFKVTLGRNPTQANIIFADDNWMSGIHGTLLKEGERIIYQDGYEGKLPTNPGIINNFPLGSSKMELYSGVFLLLGSTVFTAKKYFGRIVVQGAGK